MSMAEFLWILVALVTARTAAMAFNRFIDRELDARNPRTMTRELPAGSLSVGSVVLLFISSAAVFLIAAFCLGPHCFALAPAVISFLCFYSWTKRVTRYSHIILGIALALAPGGVWYALTAKFALEPVYMMVAVAFWVAGFDIIYSCQDIEFDRKERLFSLPALLGARHSLIISRFLHLIAVLLLIRFGMLMGCGVFYYLGLTIFAYYLWYQHRLVRAEDLSKVDRAFFTQNGSASLVYMLGVLLDSLVPI